MITDRIVVGVSDCKLSERLQLEDLMLEKAIAIASQSKSVRKQQSVIQVDIATEFSINLVNRQKVSSRVKGSKEKQ